MVREYHFFPGASSSTRYRSSAAQRSRHLASTRLGSYRSARSMLAVSSVVTVGHPSRRSNVS
jgi:hypothetical protein